jgi:serine/threonine protein phosphatase PrpC
MKRARESEDNSAGAASVAALDFAQRTLHGATSDGFGGHEPEDGDVFVAGAAVVKPFSQEAPPSPPLVAVAMLVDGASPAHDAGPLLRAPALASGPLLLPPPAGSPPPLGGEGGGGAFEARLHSPAAIAAAAGLSAAAAAPAAAASPPSAAALAALAAVRDARSALLCSPLPAPQGLRVFVAQHAANNPMEDAFFVGSTVAGGGGGPDDGDDPLFLFLVADGHGGRELSVLTSTQLPTLVVNALRSRGSSVVEVVAALKTAYAAMDARWLSAKQAELACVGEGEGGGGGGGGARVNAATASRSEARRAAARSVLTTGSCVLLVLLRRVVAAAGGPPLWALFTANVGDSRAVLSTQWGGAKPLGARFDEAAVATARQPAAAAAPDAGGGRRQWMCPSEHNPKLDATPIPAAVGSAEPGITASEVWCRPVAVAQQSAYNAEADAGCVDALRALAAAAGGGGGGAPNETPETPLTATALAARAASIAASVSFDAPAAADAPSLPSSPPPPPPPPAPFPSPSALAAVFRTPPPRRERPSPPRNLATLVDRQAALLAALLGSGSGGGGSAGWARQLALLAERRSAQRCSGALAVSLSEDHTPENPREAEAVRRLSPDRSCLRSTLPVCSAAAPPRPPPCPAFPELGGVQRVAGSLAITRALGDLYLKGAPTSFPPFAEGCPYISAEPQVTWRVVAPGDSFLLLACDGVWDNLSNADAVDVVGGALAESAAAAAAAESAAAAAAAESAAAAAPLEAPTGGDCGGGSGDAVAALLAAGCAPEDAALFAAAGALQRATAAHWEGCFRAVATIGRPPPANLAPAGGSAPPLAADGLASLVDVNFGNPAQRLIGASLLRTANRRIVLIEKYPAEMARVWRAAGANAAAAAAPAVQEAMWRLSAHAPPADVLRACGELLRMEGTKKCAPGAPLVREGRRYRHDDLTVRFAALLRVLQKVTQQLYHTHTHSLTRISTLTSPGDCGDAPRVHGGAKHRKRRRPSFSRGALAGVPRRGPHRAAAARTAL